MKNVIAILVFMLTGSSFAAVTCQELKDAYENDNLTITGNVSVLNESNWKNFDVISAFSRRACVNHVSQVKLNFNGEEFVKLTTNDDSCDGGNTYGVVYSADLSRVVAHINDSDFNCDFQNSRHVSEYLASNHRCDLGAEALAIEKFRALGHELINVDSTLEIRRDYAYATVEVVGFAPTLPTSGKEVNISVTTNLKNCKYLSVSIDHLML